MSTTGFIRAQQTMAESMPVVIASDQSAVSVSSTQLPTLVGTKLPVIGGAYVSTVSFNRPSNTTAYTALDVVGAADLVTPANAGSAIHTFANIGRSGGQIQLTSADLTIADTSILSGMTSFRLHLYMASPTAILDNAAFSANSADRTNYRGFIELSISAVGGGFLYATSDYIGKHLGLTTANLFGVLQTIGGYTPASGTAYQLILRSVELG